MDYLHYLLINNTYLICCRSSLNIYTNIKKIQTNLSTQKLAYFNLYYYYEKLMSHTHNFPAMSEAIFIFTPPLPPCLPHPLPFTPPDYLYQTETKPDNGL